MTAVPLDSVQLAHRRHVAEAARHLLETARVAGAADSSLKGAVMALRAPDIGLLIDEEAEGLIERLELRES